MGRLVFGSRESSGRETRKDVFFIEDRVSVGVIGQVQIGLREGIHGGVYG